MQPIISVKNVTKKFKEVVAVDDISFDVNEERSSLSWDLTVLEKAQRSKCSPPY